MVIQYLRYGCLFISLFLCASIAAAEIFKWKDDNLVTQFTQQPPHDRPYEHIAIRVGKPSSDPKIAQQQIDELIKQQEAEEKLIADQNKKIITEADKEKLFEENCRIAQDNLIAYQNNPGRRMLDEEGNAIRLTEEERQQKIQEAQENIDKYCK